jgi:hypothetical protein
VGQDEAREGLSQGLTNQDHLELLMPLCTTRRISFKGFRPSHDRLSVWLPVERARLVR